MYEHAEHVWRKQVSTILNVKQRPREGLGDWSVRHCQAPQCTSACIQEEICHVNKKAKLKLCFSRGHPPSWICPHEHWSSQALQEEGTRKTHHTEMHIARGVFFCVFNHLGDWLMSHCEHLLIKVLRFRTTTPFRDFCQSVGVFWLSQ